MRSFGRGCIEDWKCLFISDVLYLKLYLSKVLQAHNEKNPCKNRGLIIANGGPDGTRTRDLRRDRPAF